MNEKFYIKTSVVHVGGTCPKCSEILPKRVHILGNSDKNELTIFCHACNSKILAETLFSHRIINENQTPRI